MFLPFQESKARGRRKIIAVSSGDSTSGNDRAEGSYGCGTAVEGCWIRARRSRRTTVEECLKYRMDDSFGVAVLREGLPKVEQEMTPIDSCQVNQIVAKRLARKYCGHQGHVESITKNMGSGTQHGRSPCRRRWEESWVEIVNKVVA